MPQLNVNLSKDLRTAFNTRVAVMKMTKTGAVKEAIKASIKAKTPPAAANPENGRRWAVAVDGETAYELKVHAAATGGTMGEALRAAIFNWTYEL